MTARGWILTIFDDQDQVLHEDRYRTLTDIAQVFGLKAGCDLSHYRGRNQTFDHARDLMLDRWGVWFRIKQEDAATPPVLADLINDTRNNGDDCDSSTSTSDDGEEECDDEEHDDNDDYDDK